MSMLKQSSNLLLRTIFKGKFTVFVVQLTSSYTNAYSLYLYMSVSVTISYKLLYQLTTC